MHPVTTTTRWISLLSAVALTAIPTAVKAQEAVHPSQRTAANLDSGYLANPGAHPTVLWRQDVPVAGDVVQVHFGDTNLPAGSRLRICGLGRPDHVQWHDAHSLRDYQGWSCQFEGPDVRVELHAAPGTTGNRVHIDLLHGIWQGVGEDSICDTVDDRTLSTDPRACRLDSSCTAWLFSPYAVGTAGHCISSTAGRMLHFNVPLSTTSGSTRPAHPNDQYAMESFLQFLNNGVGQDWAVMAAVRNSNTGLFPGQAQGSHYNLVNPPTSISGDIRITGYGTGNGTSGSATWNQVQKTHTGPRVSTSTANALAYRTDTTGGNSGSPVIHEQTGNVIGVHTHGGCSTNGSGSNKGTSAARSDWTAARQAVLALHTVGGFTTFGTGCGGAAGVPLLGFTGIPEIGRNVTVRVTRLNPTNGLFGSLAIGFSTTSWNGVPLPASLANQGLEGCTLHVAPELSDTLFASLGTAVRNLAIPNAAALVGTDTHLQHLALDPTAPNTVQAVVSNAGTIRIGN